MYGFPRRSAPLYIKRPFLGFDALSISGCRLWLAPNKVGFSSVSNNGFSFTLKDGSPDNRTVSGSPFTVYNNNTGKVAAYHPNLASSVPWSILGTTSARTVFYTGFIITTTSISARFAFGYTGFTIGANNSNNLYIDTGSGYVQVTTGGANRPSVFCFTAGSSTLSLYINGSLIYQNTSWSSSTAAGNTFSVGGDQYVFPYLYELIVYDSVLSSSDVAYVSSVLSQEYGLV